MRPGSRPGASHVGRRITIDRRPVALFFSDFERGISGSPDPASSTPTPIRRRGQGARTAEISVGPARLKPQAQGLHPGPIAQLVRARA